MRRKTVLIICSAFLSLYSANAAGQENNSVPVSPEAAALAKMINYPVSYNTGIPDINIPFYEINVGDLKLPITLNYHAGGFRINEQSTRAGLGWSLSTDLQITRTINGRDDLGPNGYISNNLVRTYYPNPLYCPTCAYSSLPLELYALANGDKDAAPDKFNYKLLNKSGSFYFRKNDAGSGYTIVPVPFDNIKIEYISNAFVITDTDGTVYYFGNDSGATFAAKGIETSEHLMVSRRTAWKCKQIVSHTGTDEIVFNYSPKTITSLRSYKDQVEYYNNESPCGLVFGGYYTSNNYPMNTPSWDYSDLISAVPFYRISSPKYWVNYANGPKSYFHVPYLSSSSTVVDKVYEQIDDPFENQPTIVSSLALTEIIFRGGKIQFSGADQLSTIRVLDHNNMEVKSLSLFNTYTVPNYFTQSKHYNGSNFQGTLYLDSVHVRNGSNTFERFAFQYNNKFSFGNHLKGQDAWGYVNASTKEIAYANSSATNILTLPTIDIMQARFYRDVAGGCSNFGTNIPIQIGGDNWAEAPDGEAMKRGVLQKIIYPTGGFTVFDFEANQYTEEFEGYDIHSFLPQLSGGLRIRAINNYDANGTHAGQQFFTYGMYEEGAGILLHKPERGPEFGKFHFSAVSFEQQMVYLKAPPAGCAFPTCLTILANEKKTTYHPASSIDYTYINGAPIYYQKVTEYQQNQEQTGKVVHEFYPPDYFYDFLDVPFYEKNRIPGTNIAYQRTDGLLGMQKSVTSYRGRGNGAAGYIRESKQEFEYQRYLAPQQIRVVYSFLRELYSIPEGNYTGQWQELYNYFGFDGPNMITGEYGIASTKMLLAKQIETNYEGTDSLRKVTEFTYAKLPYLQPSTITTWDSKGQSVLTTRKYAYDFGSQPVYSSMLNANRIAPLVEETETRAGETILKRINYAVFPVGFSLIAPASIQKKIGSGPLHVEQTFDFYDNYGNVLQSTGKDGVPISYLWGYQNRNPVAVMEGVTYSTIPSLYKSNPSINNPVSDAALQTLLDGLRAALPVRSMTTTYSYKPLVGMTRLVDVNNLTTYFEYDGVGRLVLTKDQNGHVISQYQYHMRGVIPAWANVIQYANAPVLRTYSYEISPGMRQLYNRFVPGGKYLTSYGQVIADMNARTSAESAGTPFNPGYPSSSPISNMARVELYYSTFMTVDPGPMVVDFIQDGTIVGTYKLHPGTTPSPLATVYIPKGKYQISFRVKPQINYEDECLHFSVLGGAYTTNEFVKPGAVFDLQAGEFYEFLISAR